MTDAIELTTKMLDAPVVTCPECGATALVYGPIAALRGLVFHMMQHAEDRAVLAILNGEDEVTA